MLFQKTIELDQTQKDMTGFNKSQLEEKMCCEFLAKSRAVSCKDSTRFHFIIGYNDGYGIATITIFLPKETSEEKTKLCVQEILSSEFEIQETYF